MLAKEGAEIMPSFFVAGQAHIKELMFAPEFDTGYGLDVMFFACGDEFKGAGGIVDVSQSHYGHSLGGGGGDQVLRRQSAVAEGIIGVAIDIHVLQC